MPETLAERAERLAAAKAPTGESLSRRAERLAGSRGVNLPDHDAPEIEPTYAQQALGGIASLVRDIPGAEAAQAGVRALVRRQPYREALSDIRGAEDSAPAVVRNTNRLIGGGLAMAALPGGATAQGAQYGALTGALSSDPNSGVESRGIQAGVGAITGALAGRYAGKLGEKLAPSVGRAGDAVATRFGLRDAVRPAVRLGEASAPKTEGLIGNGMDNVLEAVKAREAAGAGRVIPMRREQPMFDALSSEAQAADGANPWLPDVVKATERYRTESGALQKRAPNARFDWFAEQMAKRKTP